MAKVTTIKKSAVAIAQLIDAIALFRAKRYISSITLAAASEEVLGELLKLHSEKLNIPISTGEELEGIMFDHYNEFLGIKNHHAYRNKIKNELKHHGDIKNKDELKGNFEQIALMHISAAVYNYKMVHKALPKESEITTFCTERGIS